MAEDLKYLTADEAGEVLHTSGAAVRAMIRGGQLPTAYIGRRWLIDRATCGRWLRGKGAQDAKIHPETRNDTP